MPWPGSGNETLSLRAEAGRAQLCDVSRLDEPLRGKPEAHPRWCSSVDEVARVQHRETAEAAHEFEYAVHHVGGGSALLRHAVEVGFEGDVARVRSRRG
jgi:hypothetical protein